MDVSKVTPFVTGADQDAVLDCPEPSLSTPTQWFSLQQVTAQKKFFELQSGKEGPLTPIPTCFSRSPRSYTWLFHCWLWWQ